MSGSRDPNLSRRSFVRHSGALAGGLWLGSSTARADDAPASTGPLPTRVLGRTGVPVTLMTLGTAPCGFAKGVSPEEIGKIVNVALDEGINSIDTAPAYDKAEEGVGLGLGSRRKDVFLATKVRADTIEAAEASLSKSLRLMKTDCIDLLYFHQLGDRKVDVARNADGVYAWLLKQKQAGKCRFVGISGHNRTARIPKFIEQGDVDVLLTVVNFVDRHTYHIEDEVLPTAVHHNAGIVAMKVFGGARAKTGGYNNPLSPPELDVAHLQTAVRYALGVPGVATLNLGCHNADQVRENVRMVRAYKPLSPDELQTALDLGSKLAPAWGLHFGPAKETA